MVFQNAAAPVGVPQVEVEVVDEGHLPAPLHVRMRRAALGPWPSRTATPGSSPARCRSAPPCPSPPSRSAASISGRAICSLFSPLANRRTGIAFALRPPVYLGDVGVADLAERRRRRDPEPLLPVQELAHPAHRLQLRHVGLQKDPIHRAARQRRHDPAVKLHSRPSPPPWSQQPEATTDTEGSPEHGDPSPCQRLGLAAEVKSSQLPYEDARYYLCVPLGGQTGLLRSEWFGLASWAHNYGFTRFLGSEAQWHQGPIEVARKRHSDKRARP